MKEIKMEKIRLDKFISNQLIVSRSDVRTAVKRGKAYVNGKCEWDFSRIIDAENDQVEFMHQKIVYKKYLYIMMNKPAGVLSAASDKSRQTVIDLVPEEIRRPGLAPVGRLDKDTTGLLLITDDGEFAHNCISPNKHVEKKYIATLDGPVTAEMTEIFKNGVTLADGEECKPALLTPLEGNKAEIIIREGKYHQIKRMFGTVGLGVVALHRCSIGALTLPEDLEPGECVELHENQREKALFVASCTF